VLCRCYFLAGDPGRHLLPLAGGVVAAYAFESQSGRTNVTFAPSFLLARAKSIVGVFYATCPLKLQYLPLLRKYQPQLQRVALGQFLLNNRLLTRRGL
jgi:hypothetical protein